MQKLILFALLLCGLGVFTSSASAQLTVTATPTFSPAAGAYSSAQTVSISTTTPSATIYYTTNGTTPTTNSTIYSGAIIVSASERVEAIATTNNLSTSAVGSAAYTIGTVIALSCSGISLGNAASLNGFVPFPSDNAWNTNIVSASVDPNSATIVAAPGFAGWYLHPDFGAESGSGIPYVVVDSTTTPTVSLSVDSASQSDVVVAPYPITAPIEGNPADCSGWPDTYNGDAHVLVLDRAQCELYETFNTHRCNGQWAASTETIWDMRNNESRPWGWTSADAAGLSIFPGLVRYDEIASGAINHAIRFTLEQTRTDANDGYFMPPATHAAGNNWTTNNVMGMRIRLKASFDISGFSPVNQTILTAMQQYGLILADNGGNFFFQGASDPRWDDNDLDNLKQIASSNFEVVQATPELPGYDSATAPTGPAPTINGFAASASSVSAGDPVTLTYNASGDSYDYIDMIGPVSGGSVTFTPTQTNTYTLNSTNAYGRSVSTPITVTVSASVVAAPTFAPVAGTYSSTQTVTINSPTSPSATIYYTTDGTTPTTSSTQYSGPIIVSSTQTVNAIATVTGYSAPSAVGSAAYTIGSSGGSGSAPPPGGAGTCTESGTTVTLAGSTYHLCQSPRVIFNPTLAGLMTSTTGSGRFQSSSVTYQRLSNIFSVYCSTKYGYLNAQAYDDLTSGPPLVCGAIAASLWMSNGSKLSDTTYLPIAMWAITHVEELMAGSFGCDETAGWCGLTQEGPMDFGRINLTQVAYTYTILKGGGALSPTQIQLFADKMLNSNSTAHNGLGGNHANLTASCVNQGMTTGIGTLSVSGTTITFSSSVLDSTWIGAAIYSDPISSAIGRIVSVTNGNTGVLSRSEPSQSNVPYRYSKAWVQDAGSGIGNCGAVWWLWHDLDTVKWFPGQETAWPTDYPPDGGNYLKLATTYPNPTDWYLLLENVNNKTYTQVDGNLAIAVALADDDVRAANLVQSVYNWYYKWSLPGQLSLQTPYTMAGSQYQDGRDLPYALDTVTMLCNSFYETGAGTPCALTSGMTWMKRASSYYTYSVRTSNAATAQNPNGSIVDPWSVSTGSIAPEYWATRTICEAGYLYPTLQDSKYMTYIDRNIFSYNGAGSHAANWIWADYTYCDPAQAQSNISSAPKQFLFQDTDYSTCTANSAWVANGSCFANRSLAFFSSRTGWATTDTLMVGAGGFRYLGMDHANFMDWGHYQISKNNTALLYYDNAQPDAIIPGWSGNTIALGGDSNWGTVDHTGEGGIMGWAKVARWAGNDPYGDSSNNYTYAMIDMNPGGTSGAYTNISAYSSSAYAGRVNRHIVHFKKAGYQDYIVAYDDVTNTASGGESIRAYQHFFLETLGNYSTVTITPSSGGTNYGAVVNTNISQTAVLNSAYRPVAGANTFALVVDNANGSYSGGAGYTARAYMCPSTDGATCNTSASAFEGLAIHMPIAATSGSMPTITQPTCAGTGGDCTAVQIADSSSPKVAVFARQGALMTGTSFTSTPSGTAQYVVAGLAAGSYPVTVNGTPVAGSPITVNANDNTLYFESTAGLVQIGSTSTSTQAATPAFTPAGGTYSSTQTVTIGTTTPSATTYYTTDGSTPTTSSAVYSGPITVSGTETLQAIAVAPGYSNSTAGSAAYTITSAAATPTFTPAGGTYSSTQTVTISTATPSATIYYTTDGSTPTTNSVVYSGPITVSATATLQAIAVAPGYANSTVGSAAYTITAAAAATTASLSASPNPVATGQTLTLTAAVQGTGSTTPGGTVNFLSGSTPLGTAPVNSSGVATLTITTLAVGTYSITAQYSGNANFLSSTSAAVSATVYSQATTTSLTASPNPVAPGQTMTLTAAVQGTASTAPAGAVSFLSGSTLLGTVTLNSSGVATLTTASLATGTYSLTAQYSGNASFLSSTSAVVSVTVSSQATTTSLTASPNPVAAGQTLTLTAAVQGTDSTAPAGNVRFMSGSTLLGTATLNSSGVATLTTTSLAAGSYSLTTQYSGNASFLSSTSAAVSVTVNAQATTTSMTPSPNPVSTGQTLTLTAAVQGTGSTTPAGAVSFLSGSTLLGTATLNSSGVATLTTTSLAAGTYSLTAQYSGNASFLTSTSAAVSVTVNSQANTTTTSLNASPNQIATGQTLTLTAVVQGTGGTVPAGTVSFLSGSTPLGTAPVNSSGVATLTITTLAVGTYSITAQYSGNASFLSSPSAAVSVTVSSQATTTTTSLTASPNLVATGQTLTLTAAVQGTGSTVPAGAVSFLSGSTPLGTAPINSSGVATLTITTLAVGTYSLTAQYSGNAIFLSSTSASVSATVSSQAITTTTSLTASPNPVATDQTLTLTAVVQGSGSTAPAGTVNFMNGSALLGTATLNSSGVATLTTTSLAAETYSLTAQYSGYANFVSSTSAAVSVTVNTQTTTTNQSFSLNTTGSAPSQTVLPGKSALYTLSVSPAPGATLPAITLTASGLPAGFTATFSPQTIAAGSGATNVTLSIQVPAQAAMFERDRKLNARMFVVAFCILLLPFGGRIRRSGKRMLQLSGMLLLLVGTASLVGLTGCTAPAGQFSSQHAQTYTITITTASASVSQTANVTLIVE